MLCYQALTAADFVNMGGRRARSASRMSTSARPVAGASQDHVGRHDRSDGAQCSASPPVPSHGEPTSAEPACSKRSGGWSCGRRTRTRPGVIPEFAERSRMWGIASGDRHSPASSQRRASRRCRSGPRRGGRFRERIGGDRGRRFLYDILRDRKSGPGVGW